MPPPPGQQGQSASNKRKNLSGVSSKPNEAPNKRPKVDRRLQQRDVRALATQTSSKAFKNGELDVDKFVKAREFEIRALEEGMTRSRKAQNLRAFQQVPKELRRRTASHNVKRTPKRLRPRAQREMKDDNTPTVTARRRKPNSRLRLRVETAKRLRALGSARKLVKQKAKEEGMTVVVIDGQKPGLSKKGSEGQSLVTTRAPRIKKAQLAKPPAAKAKFRKRQFDKTWLPTHLFHAKRAHMTPPKQPLWRFSIPLTPTTKSYRPSHRALNERGALAWDTSYMSTVGLEGRQQSLEGILKALGIGVRSGGEHVWSKEGEKWRRGLRAMESFAFAREEPHELIAPVVIMWSVAALSGKKDCGVGSCKRKIFIRVHPSAFSQLWEELTRLTKIVKPHVSLEDLRFEIGSIEISGPGATEALLSALWPTASPSEVGNHSENSVESTWKSLAGLTNQATLPANVLLGFNVQDPRLHHPPRTIKVPDSEKDRFDLLRLLATWPADQAQTPQRLFDRVSRVAASAALPSQKSINRRKALADPGQFPLASPKDPQIPVLLYSAASPERLQSKWILLLPWKCVQPVWYGIMYYPLSTGGQPRLGGLQEQRQSAFEAGVPWFPADFPGTKAGWEWEMEEGKKREEAWQRLPKSKRVNWDSVDLGNGQKGEIGKGWACDWHALLRQDRHEVTNTPMRNPNHKATEIPSNADAPVPIPETPSFTKSAFTHVTTDQARALLRLGSPTISPTFDPLHALIHVRITLLSRGVPQTCARIYRLPSHDADQRRRWLALHPSPPSAKTPPPPRRKHLRQLPTMPPSAAPPHEVHRRLAQSLLTSPVPQMGDPRYPSCPREEDLIGFVTTGNFNLSEGRATGVGCVLLARVLGSVGAKGEDSRLCVIRNAGNTVGRLAKWEVV